MDQERLQSFLILACQKDLTDAIDLEDVSMNSGGLRGAKGTMAPGPTLLVVEKGPHALEKIRTKSQKSFSIHPVTYTYACRDVSNQRCGGVKTPNF